jgi:Domain of unknown function (DUF4351)
MDDHDQRFKTLLREFLPEFDRFQAEQFPEADIVVNSIEERGRLLGKRDVLRKQLEKKFGPLPPDVLQRVEALSVERLDEIALSYTDVSSLKELGLTDD